jgi:hypothetical protein
MCPFWPVKVDGEPEWGDTEMQGEATGGWDIAMLVVSGMTEWDKVTE